MWKNVNSKFRQVNNIKIYSETSPTKHSINIMPQEHKEGPPCGSSFNV